MTRRIDSQAPNADRSKLVGVEFTAAEFRALQAASEREERPVPQVIRYRLRRLLGQPAAADAETEGVA